MKPPGGNLLASLSALQANWVVLLGCGGASCWLHLALQLMRYRMGCLPWWRAPADHKVGLNDVLLLIYFNVMQPAGLEPWLPGQY